MWALLGLGVPLEIVLVVVFHVIKWRIFGRVADELARIASASQLSVAFLLEKIYCKVLVGVHASAEDSCAQYRVIVTGGGYAVDVDETCAEADAVGRGEGTFVLYAD
jgi:hypothetical protein